MNSVDRRTDVDWTELFQQMIILPNMFGYSNMCNIWTRDE